mmetsp:Transcript_16414/g.35684  ORF Transcript_16414/g.35684 Transcript_16414/m.35684 type:complete len:314 (+) Transcript_16414:132-1073(+)
MRTALDVSSSNLSPLHPQPSLLRRSLPPLLGPLPLLPRPLPRLLCQLLEPPAPRQAPEVLHAERQIVVPPPFVLVPPSRPLLLLPVQLGPHGEDGGVALLHTDGREGVEAFGEVGPSVLHHGHEVELDLCRGVVREAVLDGVARHPHPPRPRGARRTLVRILVPDLRPIGPHANGTRLQPVQFVDAPVLLVGDVRDEVKDVVVVRGDALRLRGIAEEGVLGPPERVVRRANLVAAADGLPPQVRREVRRERLEVAKRLSQHQLSALVVVVLIGRVAPSVILAVRLRDGVGSVEQHAEDGLRGAGVVGHLPGEE